MLFLIVQIFVQAPVITNDKKTNLINTQVGLFTIFIFSKGMIDMPENRVVAQLNNSAREKEQKYMFYCEGCKENHMFDERGTFNGDIIKPTFTPSLLMRSGHYVPEHDGDSCWCTYNAAHPDNPAPFKCRVCHSFVTDGKIQYLSDCTHELAGQTIDLKSTD
jgi:hypothetical protein